MQTPVPDSSSYLARIYAQPSFANDSQPFMPSDDSWFGQTEETTGSFDRKVVRPGIYLNQTRPRVNIAKAELH